MEISFENRISVFIWIFLENNANIFYLKTGFPFFWACNGNLWKIMPTSSIWKRNFRVFSGLMMGALFENGISVFFWAFLENNAGSFYLKTGIFFLGLWWGPVENNANILYLKTGFPLFFFGLWWQPLENNINIFYLKSEFPYFFWACNGNLIWKRDFRFFCSFLENNVDIFYLKTGFPFFWICDGNLWKIISIFFIWKRNFRVFSGFVMGNLFENRISVFFCAFLEKNPNIFYLKTGFPFFWACDGKPWKIMPIFSIWKWDFRCFFCFWWQPLENNINIFYLKTEFPFFFGACDGNIIWKRDFRIFSGFSGK